MKHYDTTRVNIFFGHGESTLHYIGQWSSCELGGARYTAKMPKGQEKETSKTSPGLSLESSRESRDISNILHILDSLQVKTNPFGANVTGENSYRRAERISAALHLITNHVPEAEPLRRAVRKAGIELLELILELRTGLRSVGSEKGQVALAAIRELVSHVRLLAVSGYVSVQNAGAVAEALDELGSLIVVSQRSTLAEQMTLSRDDLVPPAQVSSVRVEPPRVQHARAPQRRHEKDVKDAGKGHSTAMSTARADQILDILKLGGELGIKDISANLPQYSEKMVQRELAELVRVGKVGKGGAKRWSRYRVASSEK
jgi:hypothetical protein